MVAAMNLRVLRYTRITIRSEATLKITTKITLLFGIRVVGHVLIATLNRTVSCVCNERNVATSSSSIAVTTNITIAFLF